MFADAARGTLDEFNLRMFNHRMFEAVERKRLYSPEFAARLGSTDADRYFLGLMVDSAERAGEDPVDRALWTDTQMYLPDTLLVKVDIAAMSVSLEGRSPLLDTHVMEFAASLPRTWKVTARQSKKILKEAHEGILPHDVLYRRKMGFSVPLKHWLRGELYGYARDILLDPASIRRGYFRRDVVENLIEDHRAGRRNNATRLWALLMLEHWHREILEGSRARADQARSVIGVAPRRF
jgi:asparagine synthase (glutamine-hydrolysing)